ncbi:hypothetical protein PR048_026091 [Dryococelus australis]|uniref:YqaJ viral recombinase domain-containing protein n=1 Tax=Dryococelus australis TaxID=614101 RepID=A0ABQ9GKD2_9NEOP|nr:hypothetical protein PR048_026091 [Dryococelus australis]
MPMGTETFIPGARFLLVGGRIVTYTGAETLAENGYRIGLALAPEEGIEEFHYDSQNILRRGGDIDKKEVEEITREQSACYKWKEHRSKQLMASFFETVCKMKATTSCANVVKQIHYNIFKGNRNTSWGLEKEAVALSQYATENNISISQRRLVIEHHPFLGASRDGLIGEDAVLEVKCPTTANLVTPLEAVCDKILNSLKCEMAYRNRTDDTYMYQQPGIASLRFYGVIKIHTYIFETTSDYLRLPVNISDYLQLLVTTSDYLQLPLGSYYTDGIPLLESYDDDVVILLVSHRSDPGSIPCGVAPNFCTHKTWRTLSFAARSVSCGEENPRSLYLVMRDDGDDLVAGVLWSNVSPATQASNANAQPDTRIFLSHSLLASPTLSEPKCEVDETGHAQLSPKTSAGCVRAV